MKLLELEDYKVNDRFNLLFGKLTAELPLLSLECLTTYFSNGIEEWL